jgi:hypothetical protein
VILNALEAAVKAPLGKLFADALSPDYVAAGAAIALIGGMAAKGRPEAIVFLRGLMQEFRDADWDRRGIVVSGLSAVHTSAVAEQLAAEIRSTKPVQRAHPYLAEVVDALCGFPIDLVRDVIAKLETDGIISKLPAESGGRLRAVLAAATH